MIGTELDLIPILGRGIWESHYTGIVEKDVESRFLTTRDVNSYIAWE